MNTVLLKSISIVMSALTLMGIAITGGGQVAMAGEVPTVTATHEWVSTTDLGDGTYAVTYKFTFTNTGDVDINHLQVEVFDSVPPSALPGANSITVGEMWIGATATVTGDIASIMPVDADTPMIMMIGHGEGIDGFGEPVGVAVMSEQEAVQ